MSYKTKLYDESYSHEWNPTKTDMIRIKKALKLVERNGKVLDVGCFSGMIGKEIAKLDNEVYGVDLSLPAIKKAKSRNMKTIRYDLDHNLPIKSNSFDGVFAGEIIEHIYDVDTFLKEINRILKKNGYLVMTTPNLLSFWNRFRAVLGISFIDFNKDKQHIRFFTKNSLRKLLEKHGFKIEKIEDVALALPILTRYDIIPHRGMLNMGENLVVKARKN